MTIVYAIIMLLILIFVHEIGHLVSAKLTGIRVNEFALGMGPRLGGFVRGETKYSFRLIPFGGYCAMEGEDEDSEDPRGFNNKPARVRALVLFAGSIMNILLAIVLLAMLIFSIGPNTIGFFFESFAYGAKSTVTLMQMMYEVLGGLVTGQQGVDQLTGPVGIVMAVGETAQYGFFYLVQLTALISLNLGIVNLLPFPALDGGRLIFLLIRKITGRAITNEVEGRVHLIGICVLFAFMALITFQDIDRFFINKG